ncbi:SAM-dependent methyltransferase [Christensenellaceae bacterium OttesenSCG-928-M15]|nr:SAM-dependent methyltransferase [Christensenellaceae bacterium OttesenSCG-928-M15]
MAELKLNTIGRIESTEGAMRIVLDKAFAPALTGLDGFSHVQILWWFSGCDNATDRGKLTEKKPYRNSPDILGTFATRSPMRPNPLALDTVQITYIDHENATIGLTWIEAFDGSPVLDIKPYTPSMGGGCCWPQPLEDQSTNH